METTTPRCLDGSNANLSYDAGRGESDLLSLHTSPSTDENLTHRTPEFGTDNSSSRLENLPPELRYMILTWMPDLPTLRSLIHASPTLHAQYRCSRDIILRACLGREFDGFGVDAYANLLSRVRELGHLRTNEKITGFLTKYQHWLSMPTLLPVSTSPSQTRWMVAYHLSVAWPLSRLYSQWALTNLRGETSTAHNGVTESQLSNHCGNIQLRRSEEVRIFRALYRYETYYHLFGQNKGQRSVGFRLHEINDILFCLFDPWEAEAVGCIELFVREKYESIFRQVQNHLSDGNPRFRLENGTLNPQGSFDLRNEHDDYMDGTMSRGLKTTIRLLTVNGHENLINKMERCLTRDQNMDAPMRKSIASVAQDDRRDLSTNPPSIRDEAQQRRERISYIGDLVPPNGPPFAWVLLWNEQYANLYGDYVPIQLRRWGYVMWNEPRWSETRAKDLVVMQWNTAPELVEDIEGIYGWSPLQRSTIKGDE